MSVVVVFFVAIALNRLLSSAVKRLEPKPVNTETASQKHRADFYEKIAMTNSFSVSNSVSYCITDNNYGTTSLSGGFIFGRF